MKKIKNILILYCLKRAKKYNDITKFLLSFKKEEDYYLIGLSVITKDKWLNRARKLSGNK